MIRLRDGETNMLAGLIRDDERRMLDGIPGLSDLPVVGRLFAHNKTETNQTDIILTLTPHIIRVLDVNEADLRAFRVGRDSGLVARRRSAAARSTSPRRPLQPLPRRHPPQRAEYSAARTCCRVIHGNGCDRCADDLLRSSSLVSLYASFDTLAPSPWSRSTSCA